MNYSSDLKNPIFKTIQLVSDELNYPTYVVGGWVRDLLLNKEKDKTDIDFVCVGSGIHLAEKVAKKLKVSTQTAINLHEKGRVILKNKLESKKISDSI